MPPTRKDAALLTPEWLMREAVVKLDLISWWVLHELAHTAQVTIWKLVGGLRRLDLIYMRDGDKTIYRSRDEFIGQRSLFWQRAIEERDVHVDRQ